MVVTAIYKDKDVFIHYTNSRMDWCLISKESTGNGTLKVDTSELKNYTKAALEQLRNNLSFNSNY